MQIATIVLCLQSVTFVPALASQSETHVLRDFYQPARVMHMTNLQFVHITLHPVWPGIPPPSTVTSTHAPDRACTVACSGDLGAVAVALALTGVDARTRRTFEDIKRDLTQGRSAPGCPGNTADDNEVPSVKRIRASTVACDKNAYASAYFDWQASYVQAGTP